MFISRENHEFILKRLSDLDHAFQCHWRGRLLSLEDKTDDHSQQLKDLARLVNSIKFTQDLLVQDFKSMGAKVKKLKEQELC